MKRVEYRPPRDEARCVLFVVVVGGGGDDDCGVKMCDSCFFVFGPLSRTSSEFLGEWLCVGTHIFARVSEDYGYGNAFFIRLRSFWK